MSLFIQQYFIKEFDICNAAILLQFIILLMPILTIILVLIVVGVLLWLINTYIPMQRSIKNILNAVVVIVVVIWLLKVFGLLSSLQNLHT